MNKHPQIGKPAQLNIKDTEVRELAIKVAQATGESLTGAIKSALREKLERQGQTFTQEERFSRIMEIGRQFAALPDKDTRSAEDVLGYDENGLPT